MASPTSPASAASSTSRDESDRAAQPRPLLAAWSLARREWVRFARQPNRVAGAIGQPLLFWILFGAGLGPTFQLPATGPEPSSVSYREFYFPGTAVLILLFTAIFTTISVIEDRREGFLQSVLVAPLPRWSMVLGKLAGGTLIALVQGLLFLALAPTLGLWPGPLAMVELAAFVTLLAFALTSLGFVFAWRLDSTQGFHAIMSLVLMPLWLLSGAFFPVGEGWLGWIMRLNPLSYGVAGVRSLLYDGPLPVALFQPARPTCWLVMLLFAGLLFLAAWRTSHRRTVGDLA